MNTGVRWWSALGLNREDSVLAVRRGAACGFD